MKTAITSTLLALTILAGVAGSANASEFFGYPQWAQDAFEQSQH